MIRLSIPHDPYWLDLDYGVRLYVRPPTTAEFTTARSKSYRRLQELRQERDDIEEVGGDVVGIPALKDEDAAVGFSHLLYVAALAQAAILEWEGVLNAAGTDPAVITPEAVADLMKIEPIARQFLEKYMEPQNQVVQEGNAWPAAPGGTGAAGASIAPDAAPKDSPVPGGSGPLPENVPASGVPISNTPPTP